MAADLAEFCRSVCFCKMRCTARIEPGTKKGLHDRNSPTCTLSQNGYGDSCGCLLLLGVHTLQPHHSATPLKKPMGFSGHSMLTCDSGWGMAVDRGVSVKVPEMFISADRCVSVRSPCFVTWSYESTLDVSLEFPGAGYFWDSFLSS